MSRSIKKEILVSCDFPSCTSSIEVKHRAGDWSVIHIQIGKSGRFSRDLDICPDHTNDDVLDALFDRTRPEGA